MTRTLLCLALVLSAADANAEAGAFAVGVGAEVGFRPQLGASLAAEWGMADWLSVRGGSTGLLTQRDNGSGVSGHLGLVTLWDVWTWVPEASVRGGIRFFDGRWHPSIGGELGVRYHLSLDRWLTFFAGVDGSPGDVYGFAGVRSSFRL